MATSNDRPRISIIVAAADNDVISSKGGIPWHIPNDTEYYRAKVRGHAAVMGRGTLEAIGSDKLPGAHNIVVSRQGLSRDHHTTYRVARSLDEALVIANRVELEEIFIIGGASIYSAALEQHLVQRIYLTRVHLRPRGDARFSFNERDWKQVSVEHHTADKKNEAAYTYLVYDRLMATGSTI